MFKNNTLNVLRALLRLIHGNLKECQKKIWKILLKHSNFAPTFVYHHLLPDINFKRHCLIKNNVSIPKKVINPYIFYSLNPQLRNLNTDFTLNNCLFESVKPTSNADLDK